MDISRAMVALLAAGIAILPACDGPGGHSGHDHDHGPHTAQVTVWENGYEAFVEYEYPVADVPVQFITHIAEIDTGEPRRDGPVTFVLRAPTGEETRHVEERVARDGIYLPTITFPSPGAWTVAVEVPGAPSPATTHLGDLEVYPTEDEAIHAPAPQEVDGISFLKEQQWKLSMLSAPAARRSLVARREFPGRVFPRRGHRVSIASPLTGRLVVPPDAAVLDVGAEVKEGDVLVFVEPSLPASEYLQLEIKLAEAEAEAVRTEQALELARATFSRNERLESVNAKSKREVERARYELEAATAAHGAAVAVRARYDKARSLLRSFRTRGASGSGEFGPLALRAPISGTVVKVAGSPGELVTPDTELFAILDASVVVVEAAVPEHEASRLEEIPDAYVELENAGGQVTRVTLTPVHAGLEVDPATRTVPFHYHAANPDGRLRVGMAVDVLMETGEASDVVAIPESALVDDDGKYVVFVQLAGETFERREVTVGIRGRGLVEIVDGLDGGERVVTTDPWAIRLASLSTVIPAHGHEH